MSDQEKEIETKDKTKKTTDDKTEKAKEVNTENSGCCGSCS